MYGYGTIGYIPTTCSYWPGYVCAYVNSVVYGKGRHAKKPIPLFS